MKVKIWNEELEHSWFWKAQNGKLCYDLAGQRQRRIENIPNEFRLPTSRKSKLRSDVNELNQTNEIKANIP